MIKTKRKFLEFRIQIEIWLDWFDLWCKHNKTINKIKNLIALIDFFFFAFKMRKILKLCELLTQRNKLIFFLSQQGSPGVDGIKVIWLQTRSYKRNIFVFVLYWLDISSFLGFEGWLWEKRRERWSGVDSK